MNGLLQRVKIIIFVTLSRSKRKTDFNKCDMNLADNLDYQMGYFLPNCVKIRAMFCSFNRLNTFLIY